MKVKVGDKFKDTKPFVRVGNGWKSVTAGWVRVGTAWKKFYTSEYVHTINATTKDFNLYNALGKKIPDADTIVVVINSGKLLYSSRTSTPAFNVGNAFAGKTIKVINNGTIRGKDGRGGRPGTSSGGDGLTGGYGGTALYVKTLANKMQLTNNGVIEGGAGGGGGGGGARLYRGTAYNTVNRRRTTITQQVKGGTGANGGSSAKNGSRGEFSSSPSASYGVSSRGGIGGRSNGRGKAGNAGGASGIDSRLNPPWRWERPPSTKAGKPGKGGRGGYAIDGHSKVTYTKAGTLRGSKVH